MQRVLAILPIEGADLIELVRINGWQCITKKGEFRSGELGVFFEIDSVPPDTDTFRFLWTPRSAEPGTIVARPSNFRIRTMKLRGTLSQGLFLPLSVFGLEAVAEGDDVTELLGVSKYELPVSISMSGEVQGAFPAFVPKTDELRVQSVPEVLDELRALPYVATLKCDGTSATYVLDYDGEMRACSRNLSLKEGENVYWKLARKLDLEAVLRRSPELAIQGEICGPGIQKNRLGLKEPGLFVFNVYNHKNGRYLNDEQMREFCAQNGLVAVPVVEQGESFIHTQESLLALAEGKYPGTSTEREGIVIRPLQERRSEVLGGRLSFKAISNRFLLKEGD